MDMPAEERARLLGDNPFLAQLAGDPEHLFIGPHGRQERQVAAEHPELPVLDEIRKLADYAELLVRASVSREIGLVREERLSDVEPGYRQRSTGRTRGTN